MENIAHGIYQFKVTLSDSVPAIWRRIQVKDGSLDTFHEQLQLAMGWTNSHLHRFRIENRLFCSPEQLEYHDDDSRCEDSSSVLLNKLLAGKHDGFRFEYEYDFGDCWRHIVEFEAVGSHEAGVRYPRCLAGARACPPEDCGGTHGYAQLLQILQDPTNVQYADMRRWAGRRFDPEAFDADKTTRRMQRGLRK